MKNLYLITDNFPYGKGEKSFILPELPYLKKQYNITILSKATEEEKRKWELITKLDSDIEVKSFDRTVTIWKKIGLLFMAHLHAELWCEYGKIIKNKKHIIRSFYEAAYFYSQGLYIYLQLKKMPLDFSKRTVFYSYWYYYQSISLVLLKNKYPDIKIVTRTHGYDLYNERTASGRQSFKEYMSKKLDGIFFASEAGFNYYKNTFLRGETLPILKVCRLGVSKKNTRNPLNHSDIFELVSCSNVISLKRVELIVQALADIENYKVHWTHFGDGDCMDFIKRLAGDLLDSKENITYSLLGHIPNLNILRFYEKNAVDCFISTSSTEGGCPVSIQEALSYGIPIIGTNVGGISETIDGNGFLLSDNPSIREITDVLKAMIDLKQEDKALMRDKSYQIWSERFNSDKNYKSFVKQLVEL